MIHNLDTDIARQRRPKNYPILHNRRSVFGDILTPERIEKAKLVTKVHVEYQSSQNDADAQCTDSSTRPKEPKRPILKSCTNTSMGNKQSRGVC